jgi:hypothetical protein
MFLFCVYRRWSFISAIAILSKVGLGLNRTFSRGYFQSCAHVGISHCFVPSLGSARLGSARVSVQPRFVGENDCVLHYSFSEASNVSIV